MTQPQRNAIVTGAASGLGRALAVRLAQQGWQVALADVNEVGARETLAIVEAAGGTGRVEKLDVARLDDWQALAERLKTDWPQLDLLVNNAGLGCSGDVGVFPVEEWQLLLNVNLYGAIYGCHALVDWLKQNPAGSHMINVASFAAIAPSPSMAAYNVAKAGVVALSETLYSELKPAGVGVTVVCPMFFATRILETSRAYDALREEINLRGTQRSSETAEDVADAALRAMRRKQLYAMPGRQARWYWWLRRLSPTGFLDGIARQSAKLRQSQAEATPTSDFS